MSDAIKKEKSLKVNAVLNVIKQCSTAFFPLITYPYISRVLGSDNFGRISFASSIIEYGMVFAALGIPTYILREGAKVRDKKDEIKQMTSEVFTLSIITMLIVICTIVFLMIVSPRLKVESLILSILSFNIVFSILGRDWIYNGSIYCFKDPILVFYLYFCKKLRTLSQICDDNAIFGIWRIYCEYVLYQEICSLCTDSET